MYVGGRTSDGILLVYRVKSRGPLGCMGIALESEERNERWRCNLCDVAKWRPCERAAAFLPVLLALLFMSR